MEKTKEVQELSTPAGINICGGDFVLSVVKDGGGKDKTTLSVMAPTAAKKQVVVEGAYSDWPPRQWNFFRELARRYYGEDVEKELERLEEETRAKKIAEELPIVEDSAPPHFWAAHTLELHMSREGKYVRIVGHTYPHRAELRQMGLAWDARLKAWGAQFSEELVQKAVEFVRKNDQKTDPIKAGMVRCEHCGRWTSRPRQGTEDL
jgi:hypothetical protein